MKIELNLVRKDLYFVGFMLLVLAICASQLYISVQQMKLDNLKFPLAVTMLGGKKVVAEARSFERVRVRRLDSQEYFWLHLHGPRKELKHLNVYELDRSEWSNQPVTKEETLLYAKLVVDEPNY